MTSKHTCKLKHTNAILEYFEYFCQMSSKSILMILNYTVSKLVPFSDTQINNPNNPIPKPEIHSSPNAILTIV